MTKAELEKIREFWIQEDDNQLLEVLRYKPFSSDYVRYKTFHVIEYSAYSQLQKKFEEAVEVIKFYSNGGNLNRDIWFDEKLGYFTGKRAREFLRSLDKGE